LEQNRLSQEGQLLDKKSLRSVTGKTADWNELAKDCIAFANATGGRLLIGIEDNQDLPDANQIIPDDLPDTIRRKLAERTVNVTSLPVVVTGQNGGKYIELTIPRSIAVASTTDGRYFLRIADQSKPITGDDVMRLAGERSALPWETQTSLNVVRDSVDGNKLEKLLDGLRASDRVKASVKEKSSAELLDHYQLLALIVEDVRHYPLSKISDIHQRIGLEIPRSRIRRSIEQLVNDGKLQPEGVRSGTRYRLP
jgi:ATP-dependent DNA helicase RecG